MKASEIDWGVSPCEWYELAVRDALMILKEGKAHSLRTMGEALDELMNEDLSGCYVASVMHRCALELPALKAFSYEPEEHIFVLEDEDAR